MHDPFCEWSEPCIHGEDQKHSKDDENPAVPDASYCFRCGADCFCELIVKVRVDEHAAFYDAASPYTASIKHNPFDACRVAYEQGQRDALADAKRIVAGFLDIDEKGDRRCSDPACGLCVVAPLIYAALEDLILSKGDQP